MQASLAGGGVLEGTEEKVEEVLGLDLLAVELVHVLGQHVDELVLPNEGRQMPEKEITGERKRRQWITSRSYFYQTPIDFLRQHRNKDITAVGPSYGRSRRYGCCIC